MFHVEHSLRDRFSVALRRCRLCPPLAESNRGLEVATRPLVHLSSPCPPPSSLFHVEHVRPPRRRLPPARSFLLVDFLLSLSAPQRLESRGYRRNTSARDWRNFTDGS